MPDQSTLSQPTPEQIKDLGALKSQPTGELTFGMQLVGITFNPSGDEKVNKAKQLCAELADLVNNDFQSENGSQPSYLYNLIKGKVLAEILTAQMLAVKLLTLKY